MKKPNLFIIGAPKCGTSSLANWIAQHPNVYFAPLKEARFFDTDHQWNSRYNLSEYESVFSDANDMHMIVGEATPTYLRSEEAVPNILSYNPDARFIVAVRDPVEMAFSLHNQMVFNGEEDLLDFAEAWKAQDSRAAGAVPVLTPEPSRLLYGPACLLGSQIQKLLTRVPREKLHIVFLDDIKSNPQTVYSNILGFLGLPRHEANFKRINQSARRKSRLLRRLSRGLGDLKRAVGIRKGWGLLRRLDRWNRKPEKWSGAPEMVEELRSYFREDILLLSAITGRPLLHWIDGDSQRSNS